MRIFIANESKQGLGGGWTFLRNFTKYADRAGLYVGHISSKENLVGVSAGDILFIAGATMVTRDLVVCAKHAGMKIVLRVDNAPRNSRNRNTGTSRLHDFADLADLVIYQSKWAKEYLGPWLSSVDKSAGPVILNGADTDIFNTTGSAQPKEGKRQYLYAQYNRDETKQWHQAWYEYIIASRIWKDMAHLWIVGNFSPEQQEYNFDFFMGEKYTYVGVLQDPQDFAEYLRSTDVLLLPYYNDACSNTLIEARLCGVKKIVQNGTGGNDEIMEAKLEHLSAEYMVKRYMQEFEKLLA